MANRNDSQAPFGRDAAEALGQALSESAQQIWLAGLGAFARAKEQGDAMFENLVEQGKDLRTRSRGAAEEALKSMGIVTTREIEALTRQVEALNATMREMRSATPRRASAPKRKAAAKKGGRKTRR